MHILRPPLHFAVAPFLQILTPQESGLDHIPTLHGPLHIQCAGFFFCNLRRQYLQRKDCTIVGKFCPGSNTAAIVCTTTRTYSRL